MLSLVAKKIPHFQVLQFSLGVHPCQGLDIWSRLIVTLSAGQKNKALIGGVWTGEVVTLTPTNGFVVQSNIPGEGRIKRCQCPFLAE